VIAKAFHNWERRLASVATDRVARPFEWGTDWLADQALPHGDPRAALQAWGEATVAASDATGLENENVWNALARKGLIKAAWPDQIALTPEGVAYDTGIADQILHKGAHH
jgi:hypothetical protein